MHMYVFSTVHGHFYVHLWPPTDSQGAPINKQADGQTDNQQPKGQPSRCFAPFGGRDIGIFKAVGEREMACGLKTCICLGEKSHNTAERPAIKR